MSSIVDTPQRSLIQAAAATTTGAGYRMLMVMTLLAIVTPVFFNVGPLLLSFSRILFLIMVPVLFLQLFSGRFGKFIWTDFFVIAHVLWLGISIAVNNSDVFVTFMGSQAVIFFGGYLAARATIRTKEDFIAFARILGLIVVVFLPFAFLETLDSKMIIARLIDQIPGVRSNPDVNYQPRLGFHRAQVVFSHPIHFGLYCSMAFSLILIGLHGLLPKPIRLAWAGAIGFATFLSLSSGPFLSMMAQLGLWMYRAVLRPVKQKWAILMGSTAFIYLVLEILSDRPAYIAIVEKLAFSSHTAHVRKILLDYGLAQVGRTPILGVGYNEWELPVYMSGSVDNYWLMTALTAGIPSFLFFLGAFLFTIIAVARRTFDEGSLLSNLRTSWLFVMTSLMLTLATVAIWSEVASMTFFFIGAGIWFITAEEDDLDGQEATSAPSRHAPYTRFHGRSQPGPKSGPNTPGPKPRGPGGPGGPGGRTRPQESFARASDIAQKTRGSGSTHSRFPVRSRTAQTAAAPTAPARKSQER